MCRIDFSLGFISFISPITIRLQFEKLVDPHTIQRPPGFKD